MIFVTDKEAVFNINLIRDAATQVKNFYPFSLLADILQKCKTDILETVNGCHQSLRKENATKSEIAAYESDNVEDCEMARYEMHSVPSIY